MRADLGIGVCAAHTLPAAILSVPPQKGLPHQHSERIGCLSVFYSSCHGHSVSDSPCSSVATLVCVCFWHGEGWVKMETKTGPLVWPFTALPNQCHTSTTSAQSFCRMGPKHRAPIHFFKEGTIGVQVLSTPSLALFGMVSLVYISPFDVLFFSHRGVGQICIVVTFCVGGK